MGLNVDAPFFSHLSSSFQFFSSLPSSFFYLQHTCFESPLPSCSLWSYLLISTSANLTFLFFILESSVVLLLILCLCMFLTNQNQKSRHRLRQSAIPAESCCRFARSYFIINSFSATPQPWHSESDLMHTMRGEVDGFSLIAKGIFAHRRCLLSALTPSGELCCRELILATESKADALFYLFFFFLFLIFSRCQGS